MPAPHPVRDGILAVAVGGVLALALLLGVRLTQGPLAADDPTIGATPVGPQASARDSCDRQTGGGGGPVEPDPTPGPEFPRQQHDLDNGRPVTVTSQGNAEVAYHRLAEFATVVEFRCADCRGKLDVFNTGAAVPIVSGDTNGEPVRIEWLIDTVHEVSAGPDNSLLIRATGNWTLTLKSWHDLPITSERFEGHGARILRVDSPRVRLTFAPLNSRDSLNVYAYRLADREFRANECIGRFESREFDLNGGEVLLIWSLGEWTLEPLG